MISVSANHILRVKEGGWIKVGGLLLNHETGLANATANSVWQQKL